MATDKDIRLVNTVRAAYQGWLQELDVPAFTPPADGSAESPTSVQPGESGATPVSPTDLVRAGKTDEFERWLVAQVSGLLWSVGLPAALADAFVAHVQERSADFKGRHVSETLRGWLAEFARKQGATPTPAAEPNLAETVAVHAVLTRGELGEPDWAVALRAAALQDRVASAEALRRRPLPTVGPAGVYVKDLCDEIAQAARKNEQMLQQVV